MSPRESRRAENQKRFRLGNERLHDALEDTVAETQTVPFLCECAADHCHGRVELKLAQWEVVASRPNHFVMVPGHHRSEGEEVVGAVGDYDVVEKPV